MQSPAGRGPGAALGVIAVLLVGVCTCVSHLRRRAQRRHRCARHIDGQMHGRARIEDFGREGRRRQDRSVNLSYGDNHVLKDVESRNSPRRILRIPRALGLRQDHAAAPHRGLQHAPTAAACCSAATTSRALPPWKRDVGMVFQSYALWPHMTVAQQRRLRPGRTQALPRAEIDTRVAAALEVVGLDRSRPSVVPSQLSGGQQQRVALARTIVIEPKVLLLDEPLSNLDAKLRVQVRRELRELQQRLGITTIFVTHDQEEANTICDRIAVMNDGVVQQVGTPMELYEHPANLFVAGFLGTANILEGKIKREGEAACFELTDGTRVTLQNAATAADGARLVFRPQYAAIGLRGFATGGTVALPGTIVHREFLGATVRYAVKLGAQEALVDAPFRSGSELLETGAEVDVAIAPERLQFLSA